MKRQILTLLLLFTGLFSRAQGMPVYDNANFLALAQQFAESIAQTAHLFESVEELREAARKIEQISGAVEQLGTLNRVIRKNQQLMQIVQTDLQTLATSPYITDMEAGALMATYQRIGNQMEDNIEFVRNILTGDFWNMEDSQRIQYLNEREAELNSALSRARVDNVWLQDVVALREFQEMANQARTGY